MKKVCVEVEMGERGQAVLSALRRAGIDPSDALASEIDQRAKSLKKPKAKKISQGVGVKRGGHR